VNPLQRLLSPLGVVISDYITLKQVLGRKFAWESRVLFHLDCFLASHSPDHTLLTPEAFAAWCLTLTSLSPTTRRNHMRIVRNLCLYMRRRDPCCYVPDLATFPQPQQPRRPHIFSEYDILRLLRAADELPARSTAPLFGATLRLAVVLLYTAGLRRGELVRLVLSDYDPVERTLLIRASKFHKSRLVALSEDAGREMDLYLLARRRLLHDTDSPLLVSSWRGVDVL
jgi:integrase